VITFKEENFLEMKNVNEFYLFICQDTANITSIFKKIWFEHNLINSNMALLKNDSIKLVTFFPFSENHCNNTKKLKIINEFSNEKWRSKNFFPNKISNFHGCHLKLGLSYFTGVKQHKHENGTIEFSGSDVTVAEELGNRLNFGNKMIALHTNFENFVEGTFDYAAGWYFLSLDRTEYLDFTQSYCFVPFVVVVPPGNIFMLSS
jgi:hypothetical protein